MITKRELENAIDSIESKPCCNYDDCEKLAVYYALYNELYGQPQQPKIVPTEEEIVHAISESEFMRGVDGKQAAKIWAVIDELVESVKIVNDRLYYSLMSKINSI